MSRELEYLTLRSAVRDLISDERLRHPGKPLGSEQLRMLDEMTAPAGRGSFGSLLSSIRPWLIQVDESEVTTSTYHFFGRRFFLLRGETFRLGIGWDPYPKPFGMELCLGFWNLCFYRIY